MNKKKCIVPAIVTAFAAVGAAVLYAVNETKKLENMKFSFPEGFTVTAHTGTMGTEENTIESMRVGSENADIIEFDVLSGKDGVPRLAHTEIVPSSPTLAEAFEFIKNHESIKANVDMKKAENLAEVQRLAKEYGVLDRIFFTGIRENDVPAVRKDSPEISYFLNFDVKKQKNKDGAYLQSLADKVKALGAVGLNIHYGGASKELIDVFHENGLLVSLWTANTDKEILKVLSLSPDNITSRNPDRVHMIIEEHK